ncbi:hypothetical protein BDZ85DRAFT_125206 [Elsinoe ampelina]|uniref:Secreted protein n=1 Tax=Elsinoe ampelina TaxID=302913 RepID=A0A6A6FXM1_9PEZI|nr:hypothetical protein BDZ85DRAFT_125206 [Elsinoe ampelina]
MLLFTSHHSKACSAMAVLACLDALTLHVTCQDCAALQLLPHDCISKRTSPNCSTTHDGNILTRALTRPGLQVHLLG